MFYALDTIERENIMNMSYATAEKDKKMAAIPNEDVNLEANLNEMTGDPIMSFNQHQT